MTQFSDVEKLYRLLRVVCSRHNMIWENIGHIANDGLYLISNHLNKSSDRRLLVAAGFHGEEPAGCWGILKYLESVDNIPIQLSIIPIVNPTGIRRGTRQNIFDENPNNGFCHTDTIPDKLSSEGVILMNHIHQLLYLARDGFLSLHEDSEISNFYICSFEHEMSLWTKTLVDAESEYFSPLPDGPFEEYAIKNGVAFNHCDGSFEDALYHLGIPHTACTETPGQAPIEDRILCNAAIISAAISYMK